MQIHFISFEIVPLGSYTSTECRKSLIDTVFSWSVNQKPSFWMWSVSKWRPRSFDFWEQETVTQTQIRGIKGLWYYRNILFGQKLLHRELWAVWFKVNSLPIILTVKCRSDLIKVLTFFSVRAVAIQNKMYLHNLTAYPKMSCAI